MGAARCVRGTWGSAGGHRDGVGVGRVPRVGRFRWESVCWVMGDAWRHCYVGAKRLQVPSEKALGHIYVYA